MSRVCPSWLSFILYNPVRKVFTNREKVLDESGVAPGGVILEVGAGNGFFTEALAGRASEIVAVELQEGMVRKLLRRTERFGNRVRIITGDVASLQLGESVFDVALLYYSFHEIGRRKDAAQVISRAVKPGGIAAIYEPTVEVDRSLMEQTVTMFEDAGFQRETGWKKRFTRFARLRKN